MQTRTVFTVLVGCALAGQALAADMTETAYAGQQGRAIKALSGEDIAALRKGEGMGMAKAAELNGYPGPLHVLALALDLRLTESHVSQVKAIRDRMSAAALPLGAELIERERALDQLFARGEITPERLTGADSGDRRAARAIALDSPCSAFGNARGFERWTSGAVQPAPGLRRDRRAGPRSRAPALICNRRDLFWKSGSA
jgi:hypothetical protein